MYHKHTKPTNTKFSDSSIIFFTVNKPVFSELKMKERLVMRYACGAQKTIRIT